MSRHQEAATAKQPTAHPRRRDYSPIKVYCLPNEHELLRNRAATAGFTLSAYLLLLAFKPQPIATPRLAIELATIEGLLRTIARQLDIWSIEDCDSATISAEQLLRQLAELERTREQLLAVMAALIEQTDLALREGAFADGGEEAE